MTKKIPCPYCDEAQCLLCNRPWHSKKSCDKVKEAENEASEKYLEAIGAKPCPSCGVNIVKHGGCDHMTCEQSTHAGSKDLLTFCPGMNCRHEFCWHCNAVFQPRGPIVHAADCPLMATGAGNDPLELLQRFFNDLPPRNPLPPMPRRLQQFLNDRMNRPPPNPLPPMPRQLLQPQPPQTHQQAQQDIQQTQQAQQNLIPQAPENAPQANANNAQPRTMQGMRARMMNAMFHLGDIFGDFEAEQENRET